MELVLGQTDRTSKMWGGIPGQLFVLFGTHAGGNWKLEIQDPDGNWIDVSPDPNPFSETGLWWFESAAALRYRLSGGVVGAKAWVSNANGFSVEVFL